MSPVTCLLACCVATLILKRRYFDFIKVRQQQARKFIVFSPVVYRIFTGKNEVFVDAFINK
jgi:hypothetical protein